MSRRNRERRRSSTSKAAREHKSGFERTTFVLPEGMGLFIPEKIQTYYLDVMEYPVGKVNKYADAGTTFHSLIFCVHRDIGPEGKSYVCPAKTWGKPCPMCEEQGRMKRVKSADKETIKALYPKERQLFVIVDTDNRSKGMQIFEDSFHSLGRAINEKVNQVVDDPRAKESKVRRWEEFYYYDSGSTLCCNLVEQQIGDGTWKRFSSVELEERDEQYDEDFANKAPCLDDLLIEVPYDKLKAIFLQIADEDEGEEKPSHRHQVNEEEPPKRRHQREEEEPPKRARRQRDEEEPPKERRKTRSKEVEDDQDGDRYRKSDRRSRRDGDREKPPTDSWDDEPADNDDWDDRSD